MNFTSYDHATEYVRGHDNTVKALNRMAKSSLVRLADQEFTVLGGTRHWSKDELINSLADHYHPDYYAAQSYRRSCIDAGTVTA